MEISRDRRAGPKRIGELLVAADVIKPDILITALQVAKKSATPLGRVLMGIGELTERDLQTAIEVQSLIREGVISPEFGVRALNVAVKACISLEDSFSRLGYKPPVREQVAGSELGELLLESGLVTNRGLDDATVQSRDNNLPLGRCLVLGRALPSSLLISALTAQVLMRDGKITKIQAINGLKAASRKHQSIEASLQEAGAYTQPPTNIRVGDLLTSAGLVTEGDKISAIEIGLLDQKPVGQVLLQTGMITSEVLDQSLQLQNMVSQGQLNGVQAAEILRLTAARKVPVEVILAERSSKEDEIARANSVIDILQRAGIISPTDMSRVEGVSQQLNVTLGEVLLSTGIIDKKLLQAALQAQSFIDDNMLPLGHAVAVLHYCHKTGVDFSQALKEVQYTTPPADAGDKNAQSGGWLGKIWSKVKKND